MSEPKANSKNLLLNVILLIFFSLLLFTLAFSLREGAGAQYAHEEQEFVFSYLLMGSESFEEEPYSGEDGNIRRVWKGTNGYIVETSIQGYADTIVMWVGVKDDGYVTGLTVRDMDETLSLGRAALYDTNFLLQFLRNEGDAAVGENIDALTGATVSSRAIARSVNSAVGFVTGADVTSSATEWGN